MCVCVYRCWLDKMVRENNNFDDSDSDWDSLALAAEPAPLNHVVSDKLSEHHRGTKRTF